MSSGDYLIEPFVGLQGSLADLITLAGITFSAADVALLDVLVKHNQLPAAETCVVSVRDRFNGAVAGDYYVQVTTDRFSDGRTVPIPLPFQLMESVVLVRLEPQTGCKVDFKP
ncbi:MAG: hypothetical protein IPJ68_04345 [Candidatus Moraniibacteriota bacterium]|nr:MAG: hypothetical protein IPJ68_04345 [Candidatus Moranbacteria bacterium]